MLCPYAYKTSHPPRIRGFDEWILGGYLSSFFRTVRTGSKRRWCDYETQSPVREVIHCSEQKGLAVSRVGKCSYAEWCATFCESSKLVFAHLTVSYRRRGWSPLPFLFLRNIVDFTDCDMLGCWSNSCGPNDSHIFLYSVYAVDGFSCSNIPIFLHDSFTSFHFKYWLLYCKKSQKILPLMLRIASRSKMQSSGKLLSSVPADRYDVKLDFVTRSFRNLGQPDRS